MALYGAFSSSMLGMMSQSRSLHNISVNIANVSTGGYKGTETNFSTVLSRNLFNTTDNGGVRPTDISTITKQGIVVASENSTDVAISGKGFFVMNTKQDGTGEDIYGRDGSMEIAAVNDISVAGVGGTSVTTKDGFLVDKNGNFIQGWAYTNGTVTTTGTPTSLRVDQYAFIAESQPTTTADLGLNLPARAVVGDVHQYDISIYDSAGAAQSVKLNFTKTGTLAWTVSTTSSQTPVAQVDSVTLGGTVGEVGDVYSVNVDGNSVSYTTDGTEASLDIIRDKLIALVNADPQASAKATASIGGTGIITLTAVTAGNALTNTASVTEGPTANVAQVDTLTIGGTIENGDQYSATINGTTVTKIAVVPGDTLASVRTALIGSITALPGVSAAAGVPVGDIVITSSTAGTAFTSSAATPVQGVTLDNTAVIANTTPNTTAFVNTATLANTTANVLNTTTGANTAVTFNSDGTIASPTSLALALTFNGGATTAATVDISKVTQFYGDFLPMGYTKNGYATASMKTFNFDSTGNIVGNFEDNTYRPVYKLALGVFSNPNALETVNGNVYKATGDSGEVRITTAGAEGYASFTPNALEKSNVDIADQFTKMMMTQTAYNAASTVFKTTDEMTTVARDLKR